MVNAVRTAWNEDRLQLVLIVVLLGLGAVIVLNHPNLLLWLAAALFLVSAVWQGYEVFELRPRRLAATGRRAKPGRPDS